MPPDPGVAPSILADAKDRAGALCGQSKDGCEYKLSESKEGWNVHVVPIDFTTDGHRNYLVDGDDMYFYDAQGQFTGALRGY